jgi:hypothetical protein
MSAGMFKGQVAGAGFGHFSKCRPKFYQNILDLSGLSLHQGTLPEASPIKASDNPGVAPSTTTSPFCPNCQAAFCDQ